MMPRATTMLVPFCSAVLVLLALAASPASAVCSSPTNGMNFTNATGTFLSDDDGIGSGTKYTANEYCEWRVYCPDRGILTASGQMHTTSTFDRLTIYNADTGAYIYALYGSITINPVSTGIRNVLFVFTTDGTGTAGNGFTGNWDCVPPTDTVSLTRSRTTPATGTRTAIPTVTRSLSVGTPTVSSTLPQTTSASLAPTRSRTLPVTRSVTLPQTTTLSHLPTSTFARTLSISVTAPATRSASIPPTATPSQNATSTILAATPSHHASATASLQSTRSDGTTTASLQPVRNTATTATATFVVAPPTPSAAPMTTPNLTTTAAPATTAAPVSSAPATATATIAEPPSTTSTAAAVTSTTANTAATPTAAASSMPAPTSNAPDTTPAPPTTSALPTTTAANATGTTVAPDSTTTTQTTGPDVASTAPPTATNPQAITLHPTQPSGTAPSPPPPTATVQTATTRSTVRVRLSGNHWDAALAQQRDAITAAVKTDLATAFAVTPADVDVVSLTVGSLVVVARVNHSLHATTTNASEPSPPAAVNTTHVAEAAMYVATSAVYRATADVPADEGPVKVLSAAAFDTPLQPGGGPVAPAASPGPGQPPADTDGGFSCASGCQIVLGSSVVAVVVVAAGAALFVTARRRLRGDRLRLDDDDEHTLRKRTGSMSTGGSGALKEADDGDDSGACAGEDEPMVRGINGEARVYTPDTGGVVFPSPVASARGDSPSARVMTPMEAAAARASSSSAAAAPPSAQSSSNAKEPTSALMMSHNSASLFNATGMSVASDNQDGEDEHGACNDIDIDPFPLPATGPAGGLSRRRSSQFTDDGAASATAAPALAASAMTARERVLMLRSRTRRAATATNDATPGSAGSTQSAVPLVLHAQLAAAQARKQQLRALAALSGKNPSRPASAGSSGIAASANTAAGGGSHRDAVLARVNSDWDRPSEPAGNPMRGVGHAKRRVHFATDTNVNAAAATAPNSTPGGSHGSLFPSTWGNPAWAPGESGDAATDGSPAAQELHMRQSQPQQKRRLSSSVIDLIFDAVPVASIASPPVNTAGGRDSDDLASVTDVV